MTAFAAAAEAIRDRGDFSGLGSGAAVARLLGGYEQRRSGWR